MAFSFPPMMWSKLSDAVAASHFAPSWKVTPSRSLKVIEYGTVSGRARCSISLVVHEVASEPTTKSSAVLGMPSAPSRASGSQSTSPSKIMAAAKNSLGR